MDEWLLKSTRPHWNSLVHNFEQNIKINNFCTLFIKSFNCSTKVLNIISTKKWLKSSSNSLKNNIFASDFALNKKIDKKYSKVIRIITCLCGRVVSKIHSSTLILTCLWTSKRVLTKSLETDLLLGISLSWKVECTSRSSNWITLRF